ncbi:MAG TPA: hypothetical protein PKL17_12195 [Pseudomonadota bacterium]|nr:hypothetical protein [Pseudomonadota bacterium]HNK45540.1 hypothetical protein [Pseudomonadota bacterium]
MKRRWSRCAQLAPLFFTACTSYAIQIHSPPLLLPSGPKGTGQICVIRPQRVALLVPAVVHDGGKLVGMTQGPSYFCYLAAPGYHRLSTSYGDDIDHRLGTSTTQDLTVLVNPSGRIYVHHDVSKILTLSISQLREAEAMQLIAGCDSVSLSSTPNGTPIPNPADVIPAEHPKE